MRERTRRRPCRRLPPSRSCLAGTDRSDHSDLRSPRDHPIGSASPREVGQPWRADGSAAPSGLKSGRRYFDARGRWRRAAVTTSTRVSTSTTTVIAAYGAGCQPVSVKPKSPTVRDSAIATSEPAAPIAATGCSQAKSAGQDQHRERAEDAALHQEGGPYRGDVTVAVDVEVGVYHAADRQGRADRCSDCQIHDLHVSF